MEFNESYGEPTGKTVNVIGFGRRFVAYFIDGIILSIIQFVILFGAGLVLGVAGNAGGEAASGFGLVLNCLTLLIAIAYFVAFWATSGQTPGKMVMGIKVIGTDGSPVSWGKAILRYIGYIISGLILALGFIWVAFDRKRQGWHDKIAGTLVVRKEVQFSPTENLSFVPSDQGSAAGLIAVIAIALIIILPIVVIAVLLLIGPAVGDVFSNIIENVGTPTP